MIQDRFRLDGQTAITPALADNPTHGIASASESALHIGYVLISSFLHQISCELRTHAGHTANNNAGIFGEIRFNHRKENDGWRFAHVVSTIMGKRLTYKNLIGANLVPATT